MIGSKTLSSKHKKIDRKMTKKTLEAKRARIMLENTDDKRLVESNSSKENQELLERMSQKLRIVNNSEISNIDLQRVLELVNRDTEEAERKRQAELKRRDRIKKMEMEQKEKEKISFKKNDDLMINRIIPYALGNEEWADKVKRFKFSTRDQKRLYDFNNLLSSKGSDHRVMFDSMVNSSAVLPKQLPPKDKLGDDNARKSLFKVKSHAKFNYQSKV